LVEADTAVSKVEISVVVTQDSVTKDDGVGEFWGDVVRSSLLRREGSDVQGEAARLGFQSVHFRSDDNGGSSTSFNGDSG